MKVPEVPAPEAKAAAKIDYVGKRLALALAPLGFRKRKARQFVRAAGSGDEAHWQIVQLQADQWNEGPRGAFFVNLAVQFPALMRLVARRPGLDWLARHFDDVDESLGQVRQRLGQLQAALPSAHPLARTPHSDETKFGRGTDMAALADREVHAACDVGVPWLQQHAGLRALADFDGSLIGADIDVRVGAAVMLGDRARAQQILGEQRTRFENVAPAYLESVRAWYAELGLDVSVLPERSAPMPPSPWEVKREAAMRAEAARHAKHAEDVRAQAGLRRDTGDADHADATATDITNTEVGAASAAGANLPPAVLAEAWIAEHRATWRSDPAPLVDLRSGRDTAALDAAGREAVLCALLDALVAAEQRAGARDPFQSNADEFDLDASVKALLAALLPTLRDASEATVLAVLGRMKALVTRWQQELVTGGYPWGFDLLVRWLAGPAGVPHRAAAQPAITEWLAAYTAFSLSAHERAAAAQVALGAAALADPTHALHEITREAQERMAELAATQPPPSAGELRRRMAEYPEQRMTPADRKAVAVLRREVSRDAATGSLPLAWDRDEWGQAAQGAWHLASQDLRDAMAPTLEGWLEGVEARPTQAFLRALRAQVAALPPQHATVWRAWMLEQLSAFETSSGHAEWATTGPRPGVGARLGVSSENLLLGMMWWAWCDTALDAAALDHVLQRVAAGAWQRLPDVGARAPVVGGLALRMSAGLGDAARARVAASGAARGASRQATQAVQRALKDPLAR